jgi:hypothetical protein
MNRPASPRERLLAAFMVGGALGATSIAACTPAQRAPVRTALEASRCVNSVVIRHIDAGDDFKDPATLTELAIEIASECNPLTEKAAE